MTKPNCDKCKKRIKKIEEATIMFVDVGPGIQPQGLLCPKCAEKVKRTRNKSGAAVEIKENEKGEIETFMVCNHCNLKTQDKQYYLSHNCNNVLAVAEMIKNNADRRNDNDNE